MSVNVLLAELFRDGITVSPYEGVAILQQLLAEAIAQQRVERKDPDVSVGDERHISPRIDDIELTSEGSSAGDRRAHRQQSPKWLCCSLPFSMNDGASYRTI